MKGIKNKEKLPKFLRVNDFLPSRSSNKSLLKPYVVGEIVKVAPWEEQHMSDMVDEIISHPEIVNRDPNHFHEHYVVVYRKDEDGKWSIKNTMPYAGFELLSTIKK